MTFHVVIKTDQTNKLDSWVIYSHLLMQDHSYSLVDFELMYPNTNS